MGKYLLVSIFSRITLISQGTWVDSDILKIQYSCYTLDV